MHARFVRGTPSFEHFFVFLIIFIFPRHIVIYLDLYPDFYRIFKHFFS